ncbi:MAG: carbohydrate kinase [Clostridiales bacterium]|nr:carbohydrate kinase [Clostridiales bacterium]
MKQTPVLMGIDIGGSNIKCAIFDLKGQELATAKTAPPVHQPHAGWVEREAEAVWAAVCQVVRTAIRMSSVSPHQVASVSLCGYGGGLCLVDERGDAVYPLIVSTDTRASCQLKTLYDCGAAERIFRITHQQPWEGQAASLLHWFRKYRPDVLSRARYLLTVKDYIRSRLTTQISCEITDVSNHNLIDPKSGSYSENLFRLSDLEDECRLFDAPLLSPVSIAGRITASAAAATGLAQDIPVAAGLYDVSACTLGCGALEPGTFAMANGTWSMSSCFSSSYQQADESTIVTVSALEDRFLLEQGSPTGTVNLEWYLDRFLSKSHSELSRKQLYDLCGTVVEKPNPQNHILFIPHLYLGGAMPNTGGAFLNLQGHHGEDDLLYAVMEGILLSATHHISLLEKGTAPFSSAVLSGGLSSSRPWSQMLCDMLQRPITIPEGSQQGARGAAMCAGIAIGAFSNFHQAAEAMVHPARTMEPRSEYHELYQARTEAYEKALRVIHSL